MRGIATACLMLALPLAAASSTSAPRTLLELAAIVGPADPPDVRDNDAIRKALEDVVRLEAQGAALPAAAGPDAGDAVFVVTPGDFLAAAYFTLGREYGNQGRHEQSAWAYEHSAELSRNRPYLLADLATQQFMMGRDDIAAEAFRRSLQERNDHLHQWRLAAFFHLARAEYPDVLRIIDESPAEMRFRGQDEFDYLTVYGIYATRALGGDVDAFVRGRSMGRVDTALQWTDKLVELAHDARAEPALLDELRDADGIDRYALDEALYYAGLGHELAGDRDGAAAHYRAAIAIGDVDLLEPVAARRALARLGAPMR